MSASPAVLRRVLVLLTCALVLFATLRIGIEGNASSEVGCRCEEARQENGWCEACGTGYLASIPIPSRFVYEALDAHGHDIELTSIECVTCLDAIRTDGFCDVCGRGYIEGQAYLSRLAFHVAKGDYEAVEPDFRVLRAALVESERCELCAAAMVVDGACATCRLEWRAGESLPFGR